MVGCAERAGLSMTFRGRHHPTEAYVTALQAAGLVVEALREPPADQKWADEESAVARWRRVPGALVLRAHRPPVARDAAAGASPHAATAGRQVVAHDVASGALEAITDEQLCRTAAAALNPQHLDDDIEPLIVADVGCALVSADGRVFTGSCIGGYLGVCAEQAAVAAMVAHGPPVVRRLVAVWRDPADGSVHALAPCGRCREFLRMLSPANLDAQVILGLNRVTPLRDLLPRHGWHAERLW